MNDPSKMSRKDRTIYYQNIFKNRGYDLGPTGVDSIWGPYTNAAYLRYLKDNQELTDDPDEEESDNEYFDEAEHDYSDFDVNDSNDDDNDDITDNDILDEIEKENKDLDPSEDIDDEIDKSINESEDPLDDYQEDIDEHTNDIEGDDDFNSLLKKKKISNKLDIRNGWTRADTISGLLGGGILAADALLNKNIYNKALNLKDSNRFYENQLAGNAYRLPGIMERKAIGEALDQAARVRDQGTQMGSNQGMLMAGALAANNRSKAINDAILKAGQLQSNLYGAAGQLSLNNTNIDNSNAMQRYKRDVEIQQFENNRIPKAVESVIAGIKNAANNQQNINQNKFTKWMIDQQFKNDEESEDEDKSNNKKISKDPSNKLFNKLSNKSSNKSPDKSPDKIPTDKENMFNNILNSNILPKNKFEKSRFDKNSLPFNILLNDLNKYRNSSPKFNKKK